MRDSLHNKPHKSIMAKVIDEIHCQGRYRQCTNKYIFQINKKEYKGICPDESYKVGDSIFVDYVIENPEYNVIHRLYDKE
jgi:hypothetical protein